MKKQLLHIHGGTAWGSYEAYINHLKTKEIHSPIMINDTPSWHYRYLEFLGDEWEVYRPSMPCAGNAKYNEWKLWFERYFEYLQDGVVLVGHSLGGTFLLKYLSENTLPVKISQLHLVAAACENGDDGEVIFELGSDYSNVMRQCGNIFVYHSKDDFVVPYEQGERIAKNIPGSELITFEDRGHFLGSEFPELIDTLNRI